MPNGGPDTNPNAYVVYPYPSGAGNDCDGRVYLLPPLMPHAFQQRLEADIELLYTADPADYANYKITDNADFTLSFSQRGGGNNPTAADIVANVGLTGANLWGCGDTVRATLMGNFTSFLTEVESTLESNSVIAPGATAVIAAQIADRVPAPPAETLFYRYGLSTGLAGGTAPYVDARPGMRLRIETEVSQFVGPGSTFNGYVGGGTLTVVVGSAASGAARVVTFDPFLSTIRSPSTTGAPTPIVAGGLVDVHPAGGARAHWRLFYPSGMPLPSQPGNFGMAQNVTLAGAATIANMSAVTAAYPNQAARVSPANVYAVFSGRAMVVPEVQIGIALGAQAPLEPVWVPLGTTLANVIERYMPLPFDPKLPGVWVRRPSSASNSGMATIRLSRTVDALLPGMLDVPLVGGDLVAMLAEPPSNGPTATPNGS